METLSPAQRSELRSAAHALNPVVMIGDKGLAESVVAEVDRALKAHGLIKVKAAAGDRDQRAAWMGQLCARLGAHPVQAIGKVLVLWRPKPEEEKAPEERSPRKKPAPRAKANPTPRAGAKRAPRESAKPAATRSGRPRSPSASRPPASAPRQRRRRTSR